MPDEVNDISSMETHEVLALALKGAEIKDKLCRRFGVSLSKIYKNCQDPVYSQGVSNWLDYLLAICLDRDDNLLLEYLATQRRGAFVAMPPVDARELTEEEVREVIHLAIKEGNEATAQLANDYGPNGRIDDACRARKEIREAIQALLRADAYCQHLVSRHRETPPQPVE